MRDSPTQTRTSRGKTARCDDKLLPLRKRGLIRGTNWEQYWQRQPHATTMRNYQDGDVRALDSQTLSVTATCFRCHELWQTHRTQNPVLARGRGFKSHLRYWLSSHPFDHENAVWCDQRNSTMDKSSPDIGNEPPQPTTRQLTVVILASPRPSSRATPHRSRVSRMPCAWLAVSPAPPRRGCRPGRCPAASASASAARRRGRRAGRCR